MQTLPRTLIDDLPADADHTSAPVDIGRLLTGSVIFTIEGAGVTQSDHLSSSVDIVISGGAPTLSALGLTAGTTAITPATVDTGDAPYTLDFPYLNINTNPIDLTGVIDADTLVDAINAASISGITTTVTVDHARMVGTVPIVIDASPATQAALGLTNGTTSPVNASATTNNGPWILTPGVNAFTLAGVDIDLTLVTDAASLKTAIDTAAISGMTTTIMTAALLISRTSSFVVDGDAGNLTALGLTAGLRNYTPADVNSGPEPYSIPADPSLTIAGATIDLSGVSSAANLKTAIDAQSISGMTTSVVSSHVHLSRTTNFAVAGNTQGLTPLGLTATTHTITNATVDSGHDPYTLPGTPTLTINSHSIDLTGVDSAVTLKAAIDAQSISGMTVTVDRHEDAFSMQITTEGSNYPPPSGLTLNNPWIPPEDSWVVASEDNTQPIDTNGSYALRGPFGLTRWLRVKSVSNSGVNGTVRADFIGKGNA